MKYVTSQLAALLENRAGRRNIRLLLRFLVFILFMITVYSVVFHFVMEMEGKRFSWLTGFYWTLTVMSTLGFGDITFSSDLGKLFSMLVLMSGMVFFLVLLPFTLIEFFYVPWVEAQSKARAPRELAGRVSHHVILTHYDPVTTSLIQKLRRHGYPYVLLVSDVELALRLFDEDIRVVVGDPDLPETYHRLQADRAALVAATGDDMLNANIAFTVREMSQSVPIIAAANVEASVDILELAGASRVVRLPNLMGQSLARRTSGGDAVTHVVGNMDKLLIAEATAAGTPLLGKTMAETRLRELVGVTVIGIWERGVFKVAAPDTPVTDKTVLVLAGSAEQLRKYDELFCIYHVSGAPVVIIGGGRVGQATGRALAQRRVDFRIVEREVVHAPEMEDKIILGDAAELEVLDRAGLMQAPAVILTTRDDDTNIYLTIYCRKLRPDIQIISRATEDRNVTTLHRAGADFVISYASMGASIIFNYLKRSDLLMVAEGLNIMRIQVPQALVGQTLAGVALREQTGCHVVAVGSEGQMQVNPDPSVPLQAGQELVVAGNAEAEDRFFGRYGNSH